MSALWSGLNSTSTNESSVITQPQNTTPNVLLEIMIQLDQRNKLAPHEREFLRNLVDY